MKKISLLAVLMVALSSMSAFAYFDKFGQAGCGLGSMGFGAEKGKNQILAMTTNDTSFQTFAITSGTSNCNPDRRSAQAIEFINNNMATLEVDMAQGQGETLVSLSEIMGCKQGAAFGKSLQRYYGSIFDGSQNSEEIFYSIDKLSQFDKDLSSICPQVM